MLVVYSNSLLAQSSAYVGETVYFNAPSVPGTIDGAAWYCTDKKNSVSVSGSHYSGKATIDKYYTGTATIACQYAYSYYVGGKKQYGNGTAYYYLNCKKSKVTLNKSVLSLNIGETVELTYYNSSGYDLLFNMWSTSDSKVATIDDKEKVYGEKTVTITAVGEGECIVTFDGHTGEDAPTCKIIVKAIPPTGITVHPESLVIKEGKKGTFSYKLSPNGAYSKVIWTSSDENVAKVSAGGVVTAISAGTAIITAKTSNGLSAYGTVEVAPLPQQVSIGNQIELALGYYVQLTPVLSPNNAISTYTWKTSDSNVATVDAKGRVRGKKNGTATITVTTENGKTSSCRIIVKQPTEGMEYRNAEPRIKTIENLIKISIDKLK